AFPTMRGRADLYIAFFEASLRQLKERGVCAFICADRWMRNQYGAELRRLVTREFSVETVVEMHDAHAFHAEVDAYPAITVIRRDAQGCAVVGSIGPNLVDVEGASLADALRATARGDEPTLSVGVSMTAVANWFRGADPWPCGSPSRLALLRDLEQ